MPEAQSRWFYIARQLQVASKLSTQVARNHLLLSVTGGSERCRSGSEISVARLYQRRGAERRSGGVEGCRIRDELIIACSNSRQSSSQFPRWIFKVEAAKCRSGRGAGLQSRSQWVRVPPLPPYNSTFTRFWTNEFPHSSVVREKHRTSPVCPRSVYTEDF